MKRNRTLFAAGLAGLALLVLIGGLARAEDAEGADEPAEAIDLAVEITDVAVTETGDADTQYRHLLETWKRGDHGRAAALAEAFGKAHPDFKHTPAVLWIKADSHYKLRQFDRAAASYQALLAEAPEYKKAPDARFYLGMARFKQGDGPGATAAFDELLEINPGYRHARHARAMRQRIEPGRVLSAGGNDLDYTGKYQQHPRIRAALASLDTLRRKHLREVHRRLGLDERDEYDFVLTLRDLPPGKSSLHAQTVNEISAGRLRSVVYFFTEHIAVDAYDLDKKILHEMTHCVQRERTGEAYYVLPKWLREGLALWTAGQGEDRIRTLLGIYATRPKDPLGVLVTGLDDEKHTYNDYAEDYLAMEYIEKTHGRQAVRRLFADLLTGMAWSEAIQRATGQDAAAFKASARSYARQRLVDVMGPHRQSYLDIYALYQGDEKTQCLARAQAYLREHPDSWVAMPLQYLIGKCYRDLGQYDRAIAAFNVVIEDRPHESTLLDDAGYYRAYCTARLGQWDRSLALLDDFLRDYSYHTGYVKKARKLQADVQKASAQKQ